VKLKVRADAIWAARIASTAPSTEISPTSFCSATKSLSSGGSTRRTAWGRITRRIDSRWLSPSERAAACWEGCTDSMPARNTSATYAE
jgi:hypothetical protein